MKKLILSLLAVAAVSLAFNQPVEKKAVKIDVSKSELNWTGYKVVGKHYGNVNLKSGTLEFDGNKLIGGMFEVDMTTIDCSDLSGGSKERLVNHLKSDDFFSVDTYKTVNFKLTSATRKAKNQYEVSGNLTIKGATHPVSFTANFEKVAGGTKATADLVIDRTLYDVKYRSGRFFEGLGDKMINDNFDIQVSLFMNESLEL